MLIDNIMTIFHWYHHKANSLATKAINSTDTNKHTWTWLPSCSGQCLLFYRSIGLVLMWALRDWHGPSHPCTLLDLHSVMSKINQLQHVAVCCACVCDEHANCVCVRACKCESFTVCGVLKCIFMWKLCVRICLSLPPCEVCSFLCEPWETDMLIIYKHCICILNCLFLCFS